MDVNKAHGSVNDTGRKISVQIEEYIAYIYLCVFMVTRELGGMSIYGFFTINGCTMATEYLLMVTTCNSVYM